MKKNSKTKDSTSTPAKLGEAVPLKKSTMALCTFPGIVSQDPTNEVVYGACEPLRFPVGLLKSGQYEYSEIDPALIRGSMTVKRTGKDKTGKPTASIRGTMRLVNIKDAKKMAGKDDDAGTVWFNREVRDPWHRILKFANRLSMESGAPKSLGMSTRTTKKTGKVVLTTTHAYEHTLKEGHSVSDATVKQVADEAKANKQSRNRAKRKNRNRPPQGLSRINPADLEKAAGNGKPEVPATA